MSKICTQKGDGGKTYLGDGKRVWKDHPKIKALGCLDELNSWIGLVGTHFNTSLSQDIKTDLHKIQSDLMSISTILANSLQGQSLANQEVSLSKRINQIECQIDQTEKKLPSLKNFLLPGGSLISSYLHLARSVCRRAESEIVSLSQKEKILPQILIYLNRLSDYFFVLARYVNLKEKQKEIIWKNNP